MTTTTAKVADLAGPGIGDSRTSRRFFPRTTTRSLIRARPRKRFTAKSYIEANLCKELNLTMVTVPLIVDAESGVNDNLDRDGSRTPIQFHVSNDHDRHPIDAQIVQAATKWKRIALKQFGMTAGEGSAPTCARSGRTTSSTMTTRAMSINGTGRRSSLPRTGTLTT